MINDWLEKKNRKFQNEEALCARCALCAISNVRELQGVGQGSLIAIWWTESSEYNKLYKTEQSSFPTNTHNNGRISGNFATQRNILIIIAAMSMISYRFFHYTVHWKNCTSKSELLFESFDNVFTFHETPILQFIQSTAVFCCIFMFD